MAIVGSKIVSKRSKILQPSMQIYHYHKVRFANVHFEPQNPAVPVNR